MAATFRSVLAWCVCGLLLGSAAVGCGSSNGAVRDVSRDGGAAGDGASRSDAGPDSRGPSPDGSPGDAVGSDGRAHGDGGSPPDAAQHVLSGHALLSSEADSSGISVTVVAGALSVHLTTAADGSYSTAIPEGVDATVFATAMSTLEGTEYAAVTAATTVGPVTAPTLTFTPLGSLSGNATLEGALDNTGIVLSVDGSSQVAVTDSAGNYAFSSIPAGTHTVVASYAGYTPASQGGVTVPYASSGMAPSLVLERSSTTSSTIHGVALLSGEADNSGITVSLSGTSLTATTDSAGNYAIDGVGAGVYALTFTKGALYAGAISGVVVVPGQPTYVLGSPATSALAPIYLARGPEVVAGSGAALAGYSDELDFAQTGWLVVSDVSNDTYLYRASDSTLLGITPGEYISNVQLTPDEQHAVFTTLNASTGYGELVRLDFATASLTTLASDFFNSVYLDTGGDTVFYSSTSADTVSMVPLTGGPPTVVSIGGVVATSVGFPGFFAAGRPPSLGSNKVLLPAPPTYQTYVVYDTVAHTSTATDIPYGVPPSPSGRYFAWTSFPDFYVYDLASQTEVVTTHDQFVDFLSSGPYPESGSYPGNPGGYYPSMSLVGYSSDESTMYVRDLDGNGVDADYAGLYARAPMDGNAADLEWVATLGSAVPTLSYSIPMSLTPGSSYAYYPDGCGCLTFSSWSLSAPPEAPPVPTTTSSAFHPLFVASGGYYGLTPDTAADGQYAFAYMPFTSDAVSPLFQMAQVSLTQQPQGAILESPPYYVALSTAPGATSSALNYVDTSGATQATPVVVAAALPIGTYSLLSANASYVLMTNTVQANSFVTSAGASAGATIVPFARSGSASPLDPTNHFVTIHDSGYGTSLHVHVAE